MSYNHVLHTAASLSIKTQDIRWFTKQILKVLTAGTVNFMVPKARACKF